MQREAWGALVRAAFAAGVVTLAAGCEVESSGGDDRVQWQYNQKLRPPDAQDPVVTLVYTGRQTRVRTGP